MHIIMFFCHQHLCDREESNGRRLLTTPAALFVANSDEDIKIDMGPLDKGWQIKGSKVKVGPPWQFTKRYLRAVQTILIFFSP